MSWFERISIACVLGVLLLAGTALVVGAWVGLGEEIARWRGRRALRKHRKLRSHIVGNVITYRGRR
jgi:hypothetical protein